MSPAVAFEPKSHTYTVAGMPVRSVTQMLSDRGMYDTRWFTEASRQRGTDVHTACHLINENDLDWSTVQPHIEPYVRAYQKFVHETQFVALFWETPLYHRRLDYAGTLDLMGWLHGQLVIPDLKTGPYSKIHDVQLALYLELVRENAADLGIRPEELKGVTTQVVELHSDGNYKLPPMKLSAARALSHGLQIVDLTHLVKGL